MQHAPEAFIPQNILRIRSSDDMSATVRIVSRMKNLVAGEDLIRVTNCSFYI